MTSRIVAYLFGLALGYWVLTLAEKEKNFNKKLGKTIGWVIIVVSILGPLCLAGSRVFCHAYSGSCAGAWACPYENHPMMEGQGAAPGPGMMGSQDKK